MVKAYLRYEQEAAFGVVTSAPALAYAPGGGLLATGSLEAVAVWDARTGTLVRSLEPARSASGAVAGEVTALAAASGPAVASPAADGGATAAACLASGHADGKVRLWSWSSSDCDACLTGHGSAVTALAFDADGSTLASGGADTDIVLWDVAAGEGQFRLRAHVGQVTGLAFLAGRRGLASTSKDGALRLWDLGARACVQTVVVLSGELWALALDPSGTRLAVAGSGPDVAVYSVAEGCGDGAGAAAGAAPPSLTALGTLRRAAPERAAELAWTSCQSAGGGSLLACASAGRAVELWAARSPTDARRHAARRARRRREKVAKAAAKGGDGEGGGGGEGEAAPAPGAVTPSHDVDAQDELEPLPAVRPKHRVRGIAFRPAGPAGDARPRGRPRAAARLGLALANDVVEAWDVPPPGAEGVVAERVACIDAPGHRTGVRAAALAGDGGLLLTAAGGSAKVWNLATGACLRTLDAGGSGLAALFAPGDRHAVLGTKEGGVVVVDVSTGGATPLVSGGGPAHAGPVWSLAALPDASGFVSASADKDVKFWEWEVVAVGEGGVGGGDATTTTTTPINPSTRVLTARHVRTLRLSDDALAVRITPDGRLLAVALLDSTIQVFFADSLKFALALYGHSLPALAIDASSDSTLLASGGADKAVRVWGLDFGDCHRAMRGHADSVMAAAFVPGTHHLFTASKDKTIKYWDCDAWELLLTLDGHAAEVWCLAPSRDGGTLVSAGADRGVRVWARGDEAFFVEEERGRRLESLFDEGAAEAVARGEAGRADGKAADGGAGNVGVATKATAEALSAADALADALDVATAEDERLAAAAAAGAPPPPANPLLLGLTPDAHVLRALRRVRPADLEAALLTLPLHDAMALLRRLRRLLEAGLEGGGRLEGGVEDGGGRPLPSATTLALAPPASSPELLVRCATLLARLHAPALGGSASARAELAALRGPLRKRAAAARDLFGANAAALRCLLREAKARRVAAG